MISDGRTVIAESAYLVRRLVLSLLVAPILLSLRFRFRKLIVPSYPCSGRCSGRKYLTSVLDCLDAVISRIESCR